MINKVSTDYLTATEQPRTARLTRKQKAFVQHLVENPKASATEAASKAYDLANRNTASSVASENLRKPAIIMALGEHSAAAEEMITGVIRDWGTADNTRKREIALDAAKYVHDKVHGRATVKVQQESTVVQIAINLTGDGQAVPDEHDNVIDLTDQ